MHLEKIRRVSLKLLFYQSSAKPGAVVSSNQATPQTHRSASCILTISKGSLAYQERYSTTETISDTLLKFKSFRNENLLRLPLLALEDLTTGRDGPTRRDRYWGGNLNFSARQC